MRLYHVARREDWRRAQETGYYAPASLEREGFVRCSLSHQVEAVANALFRGERDLLLLVIDPKRRSVEVRFEDPGVGEAYPHVYGAIPVQAVVAVREFEPGPGGHFRF